MPVKGNPNMKYSKLMCVLSVTLLSAMLLVGCAGTKSPADTTADTSDATEPDSTVGESTVLDTVPDTETQPTAPPETEGETDAETRPPKELVTFPDATLPVMSELLPGVDNSIRMDFDFVKTPFASLQADTRLSLVSQSAFADSEGGYVSDSSAWRSIGLNQLIPQKPYTVEVELTVAGESAAYTHTGMVGIHCQAPGHLFIDSGLWFCFIGNTVSAAVHGEGMVCTLNGLPFQASDGIRFRAEERDGVAMIYANDRHIFRVVFGEDSVTVCDAEGKELGTCSQKKLYNNENGLGYFRIMSHFADTTFKSMKLTVEDKSDYAPSEEIISLREGLSYGFRGLSSYTADGGVELREGILFADVSIVAGMFDFLFQKDGETCTLSRPGGTIQMTADTDALTVNGQSYDFTTTYGKDGAIMVDVRTFASMMGYAYAYSDADKTHYLFSDETNLTEEKKNMIDERFDLYRDVVYNYDDVECDNTGVGEYEAVDPAERVVGIAYTTWHPVVSPWGTSTWGMPLGGGYNSNDRDKLREHAILLRDAGVDFIFVDWSNNTDYDPVTMTSRVDFRTIEESTDALFEVWSEIPGAPKVCIFLGPGHTGIGSVNNGNHQKKADQVYRDYVEKYPELYYCYDGKPLVICYGATPAQYTSVRTWTDDRYTIRWMTGFVGQQGNLFNPRTMRSKYYWSWEERGTQTYTTKDGKVEAVTVSPATRSQGTEGDEGYIPASGRQNGATFKRQFQRAINLGAGMVLLTTWNEWSSGEHPSVEVSRDLEPSVEHGTFYYDLMREQIKKYKGLIGTEE